MANTIDIIINGIDKTGGAIKSAESGFAGLAKTIGGIAAAAAGVAVAVGGIVAKWTVDAAGIEYVRDSFESLLATVGQTGDAMLVDLKKGSAGMVTEIDLMKSFNTAASLVSKDFAQNLDDILPYITKYALATGQDVGYMLDSVVKGVGRLSPMILDNLGIQVKLEDATARAAEMFGVAAEELTKEQIQAGMTAVVIEKLKENTEGMGDVNESAAAKMAQLKTELADTKDRIGTAFLPVLYELLTPLASLAETYLPKVVEMFQGFSDKIMEVIPKIQEFATRVMEFFTGGGLEEAGASLIEKLGLEGVVSALEELGTKIDGFINVVKAKWVELEPIFQEFVDWFNTNIVPALLAAWETLKDAWELAIQLIGDAVAWLAKMWAEYGDEIVGVVMFIVETIITIVTSWITLFTGVFKAFLLVLKGDWEGAWNTIKDTFSRIWGLIKSLLGTYLEDMKKAITNKISEWKQAGTDLIMGLVDGVKAAASKLIDSVKGVVDDAIQGAKNLLGISSPSKVFQEIGSNMMSGWAKGIQMNASPQFAIQGAAGGMVASAMPSGGRGGGIGNTIIVNYSPVVSLADRYEAETKLVPYIQSALRKIR